jgi:hypothetical protein
MEDLMVEKQVKSGRDVFRRERAALQQAQFARDAKAKRRAVINMDNGTVENIISADDDFTLSNKLIVDWAEGCNIGGRYEDGKFVTV